MLLSVEFQPDHELDIICDEDGIELLIDKLSKLKKNGGHAHLMTPSWAGDELTEDRYSDNSVLVNHVRIVLMNRQQVARQH